jgi:O-antigen/teichoic acid export membrane protein
LTERHPQIPLPGPAAGPLVPARWIGPLAVAGFFGLRLLLAVVIIKLSALHLPLTEFATFSQFLMFLGFLNLISTAGLQNGVVRQIAADRSPLNVRSVMRAATGLWAAVVVVIGLAVIICRSQVSQLLVGDARGACAIPALVVLAAFAGGGQVICALLTGSGRVTSSLTAQAVGLVAATAAGSWGLLHQHALLAVLGYGAGALATPLTALWLARDLHPLGRGATRDLLQEGRQLLGLSGSFAVVASLMPLALFVMRRLFQLRFGLAALSFWLVANRISDVNTQLLGLYMAQVYLPAAANAQDDAALRRLIGRVFLTASAVMASALCVFAAGHSVLVTLFLSKAYAPATGGILIYMSGDLMRVATSIASNTALARRRVLAYIAIEAASVSLFVAFTTALMWIGAGLAPNLGYLGAYAVMTAAFGIWFHRWRASGAPGRLVVQ